MRLLLLLLFLLLPATYPQNHPVVRLPDAFYSVRIVPAQVLPHISLPFSEAHEVENNDAILTSATQAASEAKEQEYIFLKAERKRHEIAFRQQQAMLALGGVAVLLLLVLLVTLYLSRRRERSAHAALQETHRLMQAQQAEIIRQKNELTDQAATLRAQNGQLESHKQFRTKIFSIISHDLRAPFNSLKAALGLVMRKSLSESQMQHVFGLLSRDVEAAADMLQNLLVWSKAQLEESHIKLENIDLRQLVEENLAFAAAQAEEKEIRLVSLISAHIQVRADRERLNFVLRNLLVNAVKFSFEGGVVLVQVRVQEKSVTLAVRDSGKGIPSNFIPKLFTDERVTTPGTRNEKGTGLGLMLCRDFIESQNGSIEVDSEEGRGSVFSVTLQRADTCTTKPAEADALVLV